MVKKEPYPGLLGCWIGCLIMMLFLYSLNIAPCQNSYDYLGKMSYAYRMTFSPPGGGGYELYIPLILEGDGNVSQVMDDFQTIGNVSVQINDTIKGKALRVVGSGAAQLVLHSIKLNEGLPYLSLTNYSGQPPFYFFDQALPLPVWIYSNISSINISHLFYYVGYYLNGFFCPVGASTAWVHSLENTSSVGWNEMSFTISPMYID